MAGECVVHPPVPHHNLVIVPTGVELGCICGRANTLIHTYTNMSTTPPLGIPGWWSIDMTMTSHFDLSRVPEIAASLPSSVAFLQSFTWLEVPNEDLEWAWAVPEPAMTSGIRSRRTTWFAGIVHEWFRQAARRMSELLNAAIHRNAPS